MSEASNEPHSGDESPLWALPHVAAYLRRIGARTRSQRVAVVEDTTGRYPKVIATIYFRKEKKGKPDKDGTWTVSAPDSHKPTDAELAAIEVELPTAKWREWSMAYSFNKADLPWPYRDLDDDDLFVCRSPDRDAGMKRVANDRRGPEIEHPIIMIQARIEKDGKKITPPLTYWGDGKWRVLEPDRKLPAFGMEQLCDTGKRVIFLHEGGKAARAGRRIAAAYDAWVEHNAHLPDGKKAPPQGDAAHPWAFDLAAGVHLGWIGGALRHGGTDWAELANAAKRAGIELVVIAADNDEPGRNALPEISEHLGMTADHLIVPATFPPTFDIADPFPDVDVAMSECRLPGTFMTKLIPNEKGKAIPILTDAGRAEWAYIPEHDLYVALRHPRLAYDAKRLNGVMRPLSHKNELAPLIQEAAYASGRPMKLTYDPGKPPGVISDGDCGALNRHRPGVIKPKPGDAKPWKDYLEYLIPDAEDRRHVERWCATLIAKPDIRMIFGLLLISKTHGTGKSTLGYILAKIIGEHNVSRPSQSDIGAQFNEWLYEKRLALINEVYAGHSWKAYNDLKDIVTEPMVEMNQKYQRKIKVPNWIHIIACSNSRNALKMASADRRWLVPEVTETKWPRARFADLWAWLKADGFGEIVQWALDYGDYVQVGEEAPKSVTKGDVIRAGHSDAAKAVVRLAEAMADSPKPLAVTVRAARDYGKQAIGNSRVNESDQELDDLMKENGISSWRRIKIHGAMETVMVNAAGMAAIEEAGPEGCNEKARLLIEASKGPTAILPM